MQLRRVVLGVVVALAVVVVVAAALVVVHGKDGKSGQSGSLFVEPTTSPTAASVRAAGKAACPDEVPRSFDPTSITVVGVARGVQVITPPRDSNNVPGIPPLTEAGKHVFAYDRDQHVMPGDPHGNVLLNAHTWPDGSALGNALLSGLHRDGRIVVQGKRRHDQKLCYRVTQRIQVDATAQVPAYYSRTGTPQLAIIVCSGRRLGPGHWEKRTIWYATPSA